MLALRARYNSCLPDEIVLKIIEFAAAADDGEGSNRHDILVEIIGNISARFNRLAEEPRVSRGIGGTVVLEGRCSNKLKGKP